MRKLLQTIVRLAPDAAVLAGAVAVTVGAALLSVAGGCITGGILLIMLGIFGGGGKR